jgi:SnoaL-like domain
MTTTDSPAVTLALAHAEAWSHHNWDTARTMLAPDVHVISMTTQPNLPATDVTGADAYMEGLIKFAQAIEPGSFRLIGSIGDEHNSLILYTIQVAFSPDGPTVALPGARLALFDENDKLKAEQVVFFALAE